MALFSFIHFPIISKFSTVNVLFYNKKLLLKRSFRTSLVVQWLRISLPVQGTQVRSLVQEDSTFRYLKEAYNRDFPGGPVVKNPSCNARDAHSIPGQGTKIPHAAGQLSP